MQSIKRMLYNREKKNIYIYIYIYLFIYIYIHTLYHDELHNKKIKLLDKCWFTK